MNYTSYTVSPDAERPTIKPTGKAKRQKISLVIQAKTRTKDTVTTLPKTLSPTIHTEWLRQKSSDRPWHRQESNEQIVPIAIAIVGPIALIVIAIIFIAGKAPLNSSDLHKSQHMNIEEMIFDNLFGTQSTGHV